MDRERQFYEPGPPRDGEPPVYIPAPSRRTTLLNSHRNREQRRRRPEVNTENTNYTAGPAVERNRRGKEIPNNKTIEKLIMQHKSTGEGRGAFVDAVKQRESKDRERHIAEERRIAEQRREEMERLFAEERRIAEQRREEMERLIAEERRVAEQRREEMEKLSAEEMRIAEKRRVAKERQVAEERRAEEERRAVVEMMMRNEREGERHHWRVERRYVIVSEEDEERRDMLWARERLGKHKEREINTQSRREGQDSRGGEATKPSGSVTTTNYTGHQSNQDNDHSSSNSDYSQVRVRGGAGLPGEHTLVFFCSRKGRVLYSPVIEWYTVHKHDSWFVKKLKKQYLLIKRIGGQSLLGDLISLKTIGFANFIRFEIEDGEYKETGKKGSIDVIRNSDSVQYFMYQLKYPLRGQKNLLGNLVKLVDGAETDDCIFMVEVFEALDSLKIYALLILIIFASTGAGVLYTFLQDDPATGFTIAGYIVTCLALIAGIVGAGQWFGLAKPDSFAFAYEEVNPQGDDDENGL